jgi:hypothetical protein
MPNTKRKKNVGRTNAVATQPEMDGTYLLKLVLYLIVGSFWLKLTIGGGHFPLPFGLFIGLYVAHKERVQVDRKIEFALLLVAMLVGFFAPYGVYITM